MAKSVGPSSRMICGWIPLALALLESKCQTIIYGVDWALESREAASHGCLAFFSNVERLRLAHGDRWDGFHYQRRLAKVPRRLPFCTLQGRSYPTSAIKPLNKNRKCHPHKSSFPNTTKKLRKVDSLHSVHLAAQVDSRCFHSLPPKIQQKLFSKEEQDWFYRAQFEARFFDAAGEAPYPLEKARHCSRHQPPEIRFSDGNSIATSRSSTLYFDLSDSDLSSDTDMDNSLCDNFRWFDDNGDLDLRLDEYHAHVAKVLPNSPPRRRPSLRTAPSFNPDVSIRQPTSAVSRQKAQSVHRSSTFPTAPMNTMTRNSSTRPSSSQSQTHMPRSSTSSIDPSAQYYQDPEARLKLRVYLASPQNFDEAVEFGFPAQNNERTMPAERKTKPPIFTGTFLDEEGTSVSDERCDKRMNVARLSYVHNSRSSDSGRPYPRHQSWLLPPRPGNQQHTGSNREMTLKMTLTRPDLRTTVPPPRVDPLKLPLEDSGSHLWGSCEDEQGLMRKMWRKFRKQKC